MTASTRRIRQHQGFSHALVNGTNLDPSCLSCRREQNAGTRPVIMISARLAQVMPDYVSGQLTHVASG
jgi:hypothetical protein